MHELFTGTRPELAAYKIGHSGLLEDLPQHRGSVSNGCQLSSPNRGAADEHVPFHEFIPTLPPWSSYNDHRA